MILLYGLMTLPSWSAANEEIVKIILTQSDFVPTQEHPRLNWSYDSNPLYPYRFAQINHEPSLEKQRRFYSWIELGPNRKNKFFLIVDYSSQQFLTVIFDANRNNDLSDDPLLQCNHPKKENAQPDDFTYHIGKDIDLPWQSLGIEMQWAQPYVFRITSNSFFFRRGYVNHYSKVQLLGTVQLGSRKLPALIREKGYNDADFTNDGIYIDRNQNQSFEDDEYIELGKSLRYQGKNYRFTISW